MDQHDPQKPRPSDGSALEAAVDRAALAAILEARGRAHEAQQTLGQALPLLENVLGPGHYEVGVALENLASMLLEAGREDEAAALFRRALAIFEHTLGRTHPRTAACRTNLHKATDGSGNSNHGT